MDDAKIGAHNYDDPEDEKPGIPSIILRVRRPLNPELPQVEVSYIDGKWVCEDEYVRSAIENEHNDRMQFWKYGYVPDPAGDAAEWAVKSFGGEILYDGYWDAVDKDGPDTIY